MRPPLARHRPRSRAHLTPHPTRRRARAVPRACPPSAGTARAAGRAPSCRTCRRRVPPPRVCGERPHDSGAAGRAAAPWARA
eukprot:5927014-Prymnesium_polylepis.1